MNIFEMPPKTEQVVKFVGEGDNKVVKFLDASQMFLKKDGGMKNGYFTLPRCYHWRDKGYESLLRYRESLFKTKLLLSYKREETARLNSV